MSKIGLKVWSGNTFYEEEIDRLSKIKALDYIEIYVEPHSLEYIDFWKRKNFPCVIHCPHSMHGFNLSIKNNESKNRLLFNEAFNYFISLEAEYFIIHPGVLGNKSETIDQLKVILDINKINNKRKILVENKPYITLTDDLCVGSDPSDIEDIIQATGIGFCLDITHAIKYSISKSIGWEDVLKRFMTLAPSVIHVSDAKMTHPKDEHLNIDCGEFDFIKIFSICKSEYLTIETEKKSKRSLVDFEIDRGRLLKYLLEK